MAIFAPLLGLELVLIKVEYFVVDLTYWNEISYTDLSLFIVSRSSLNLDTTE